MATNADVKERMSAVQTTANGDVAPKKEFQLKTLMGQDLFKQKFNDVLGARAPQFIASMVNMVGNDANLKNCEPISVISSCLIAATLDLPIDKNLGYAWIVPYKDHGTPKAQFQMGYRGYVQLALRSGQYKAINVIDVHEGELVDWNPLSEEIQLDFSRKISNKVIGYAAYFELLNGFKKAAYWTREQAEEHRKKFSKSTFGWERDYDAMARKTVLRNLLNHWGILSIQMQTGMTFDMASTQVDVEANNQLITADGDVIDLENYTTISEGTNE